LNYTSIENLLASTRRIPFGSFDGQVLLAYLQAAVRNGLDIKVDGANEDHLKEMFAYGAILLKSQSLERRFLFLNIDAGRGLFGGQKTHVLSYLGDLFNDEFAPGPSFKGLANATSSINNIFRGVGALSGPAL
jgi:hypothetical protein